MSSDHFHVHGPHDHEVEHKAHGGDPFASRVAVATAVLATVGALVSYQGGATQNDALLFKNEAGIRKTEASDQWSFYQAKSGKQNLAELGATLTAGETAERFRAEAKRYSDEKKEIQSRAEALDRASVEATVQSDAAMHLHHRWAQAMTLIQVAIALAAIALLTRRKWMQWGVLAAAAGGGIVSVLALLHV